MTTRAAAPGVVLASRITCAGCGAEAPAAEPFPFRCPNAGIGDVDHVLARILDTSRVRWPLDDAPNPFIRYRELMHSYHLALAGGLPDDEYVGIVRRLDDAVAGVEGHGFAETPFARNGPLSESLGFAATGGIWIKDETNNVAGSHKGRHLMGVLIHLEVVERLGLAPSARAPLAIASCGNAALAAAVLAKAGGRALEVFVPPWAGEAVLDRLGTLGAQVTICAREDGHAGDPTYQRLHEAVRGGAIPFTCQGPDNGLAIEGGETLGYEMASELTRSGIGLDRLFVQVGGGALASSCVQAFDEATSLGAAGASPSLHAVQTEGGFPLVRAFRCLVERAPAEDPVRYAATHRSEFMWPWEEEPRSVADGIVDDETYDWLAVAKGMLSTNSKPVVVSEDRLREANSLGRQATGIDVDHTGSAGLAGLLDIRDAGEIDPEERVATLFTGVRR